MSFGDIVKTKRNELKLTQKELSALCGLTHRAISQIETGSTIARPKTRSKLCEVLNISIEQTISDSSKDDEQVRLNKISIEELVKEINNRGFQVILISNPTF